MTCIKTGLPRWLSAEEPACQCRGHRRCGFDPWGEKIPWEGAGNSLQLSCLENFMERGACWAAVCTVAELATTEWAEHKCIYKDNCKAVLRDLERSRTMELRALFQRGRPKRFKCKNLPKWKLRWIQFQSLSQWEKRRENPLLWVIKTDQHCWHWNIYNE